MNLFDYLSLVFSGGAIIISVLAWRKNRVIYEIITQKDNDGKDNINSLLKTGKYTILHVQSDPSNSLRTIYTLGRISE
jgi:hypothetical protein